LQINKSLALAKSAEGEKESRIVLANADQQVQVLRAEGVAKAIELEAEARSRALERMGVGLSQAGGSNAAAFVTADNFVKAFGNLAKEANTVIVPANPADIGGMVGQAMAIFNKVSATQNMSNGSTR
jgi:regulator of protease activity HflC (stomatin/prohibitin superfamily)